MISTDEMRALEDRAEERGISKFNLMENAGKRIVEAIEDKKDVKDKRILIICYHGNNGGDGFVAARLFAGKAEVDVLFIGDESKFKEEARENFKKIEGNNLIQFVSEEFVDFDDYDVIIDSILGTGVEGKLRGAIPAIIDRVNKSKAFKVSVDIPTGLNPDTGEIGDKIVNSDLIVTFHDLKKGLKAFEEKVLVVDIGIPKE